VPLTAEQEASVAASYWIAAVQSAIREGGDPGEIRAILRVAREEGYEPNALYLEVLDRLSPAEKENAPSLEEVLPRTQERPRVQEGIAPQSVEEMRAFKVSREKR